MDGFSSFIRSATRRKEGRHYIDSTKQACTYSNKIALILTKPVGIVVSILSCYAKGLRFESRPFYLALFFYLP